MTLTLSIPPGTEKLDPGEDPNIVYTLALSTAHLTPDERVWLRNCQLPQQISAYDEGGFFYVGGEDPRTELLGECSLTFRAIMTEAFERKCALIRFDADENYLTGFPTFED